MAVKTERVCVFVDRESFIADACFFFVNRKCIWPVKIHAAAISKDFLLGTRSGLTWSNFQKNRLVKENRKHSRVLLEGLK